MNDTTLTQIDDNQNPCSLYMAMELSKKEWKVAFDDGRQKAPRVVRVPAREWGKLRWEIEKAKTKFGLSPVSVVRSCYEAGRDGFWIHRALLDAGVDNLVVDPASIEVNRRKRRAKTDRLDAIKLVKQLIRHWRGERVWSVVRVPSAEDEDARQLHRALDQLEAEHREHKMRIQSLLFARGIVLQVTPGLADKLDELRLWNGKPLPKDLKQRIERELERLSLVKAQLVELESEQQRRVQEAETKTMRQVEQMQQLRGVGLLSAWILVMELFGWREFSNRREVGGAVGLTPTPYDSGDSPREQGISKTGNRRVRSLLIQLAWSWLRYQPESKLSRWFMERFAGGGKRMRRVGIVAVARKLVIALWKFLERGEVPEGARLKPAK